MTDPCHWPSYTKQRQVLAEEEEEELSRLVDRLEFRSMG